MTAAAIERLAREATRRYQIDPPQTYYHNGKTGVAGGGSHLVDDREAQLGAWVLRALPMLTAELPELRTLAAEHADTCPRYWSRVPLRCTCHAERLSVIAERIAGAVEGEQP